MIKKFLFATTVAIVAIISIVVVASADNSINIVCTDYNQSITQEQYIDNVRIVNTLTLNNKFDIYLGAKSYNLAYANLPTTKRISIGNPALWKIPFTEDTRYFDVYLDTIKSNLDAPNQEGESDIYIRTYISQYGSGNDSNYICGYRVSYRLYYEGDLEELYNYGKRVKRGCYTFEDGVTINYTYTINPFINEDKNVIYMNGYTDAMEQMDLSGLTPHQTALGIISAPINAVANVVQRAVVGFLYNPIGQVVAWILGLLMVAALVYSIIRMVL